MTTDAISKPFLLSSVSMKNFCGFREYEIRLGRFTVLIGPNNGGKTTILRAISFVADCIDLSCLNYAQSLKAFETKLATQQQSAEKAEKDLLEQFDKRKTNEMAQWVNLPERDRAAQKEKLKTREESDLLQMRQVQSQALDRIMKEAPPWKCLLTQAAQRQNVEDVSSLVFEHADGKPVTIELAFNNSTDTILLRCAIRGKDEVNIGCEWNDKPLLRLEHEDLWRVLDWLKDLDITIVNPISALIPSEQALSWPQVKQKLDQGRPHEVWRNQLHWLYEGKQPAAFQRIIDRVQNSLGNVEVSPPSRTRDSQPRAVLKYRESGGLYDIVESGSGLRTLLNTAAHIELSSSSLLLFDEPDSHLHSAVQREVAEFLESQAVGKRQIIVSTHAPDMIEQFSVESLAWVDRGDKEARKCDSSTKALLDLGAIDRSQAASFGGKDVLLYFEDVPDRDVLTALMSRMGKGRLVTRCEIAKLKGCGDAKHLPSVARFLEDHHKRKFAVCVVLDSDYKTPDPGGIAAEGPVLTCRLPCKELENLLLVQSATLEAAAMRAAEKRAGYVAGTARTPSAAEISEIIDVETQKPEIREKVENNWILSCFQRLPDAGQLTKAQREFEELWKDRGFRLRVCPGKLVLRGVRRALQDRYKISFPNLNALFEHYTPEDSIVEIFERIEQHVAAVLG